MRCIPRLPPDVSHLCQCHHAPRRDKWLHHSYGCPPLQLHQQESPGEDVSPTWLGTALTHTAWHSWSPQESTVACLPKSPTQKQVWFNFQSQDDLGDSLQLPTNLAGFLNGLKVPQMSNVMLSICLPLWPHALQYNLR